MPLTTGDMERILRETGRGPEQFSEPMDGWFRLRNVGGRCFFLGGNGLCTIYDLRPMGCRYYPHVLDEETDRIIRDEDCPHSGEFELTAKLERQIRALVRELDAAPGDEREEGCRHC